MNKKSTIQANTGGKSEFSQSKLAELLKGLTKEEYKKFGLFINSPYFNKSKTIGKLYDFFKLSFNKKDLSDVVKEEIYRQIYPGEKYDDVNARKLISNFTKLVEEFLAVNDVVNDKTMMNNLFIKTSFNRKFDKSIIQKLGELEEIYSNQNNKSGEYYSNHLITKRYELLYSGSRLRSPEDQLKLVSKSADMHFLSIKLLLFYDILNLRLHYNKKIEFDMWVFDEMVRFIENNEDEIINEHPSLYADYLSVVMLLHPEDTGHFNILKTFIEQNKKTIGAQSFERLYIYIYNHSVYRINRGITKNNSELLEIIKIIDMEDVPIWQFFAFHVYYVNAVTNAARAGEYSWAEDFINRRKELINPEIREETNSLALANLNFTKRDYDKALKYLVNVDYPNYSYYLMAKDMLIKIYWERSETEGVLATIDAMRKFLQRKDLIPERLWNCYSNFINCASKMVDPYEKNKLFEIKKLLEKEMISADKGWIEEQLKLIG